MKSLKEQLEDMKKQRAIWEKEIAELQNGINILLKLEKLVGEWIGEPTVEKKEKV